jgi:ADP-ribosylglycohydrolase
VLPPDYEERVYAGILGKIIGVYLGRPVEGWPYERIQAELGEVRYYVHERLGLPLVVPDDDISGTFTFVRALPDHGCRRDLSAAEIGRTWLNYILENRTVLWWGGLGCSTEHTAYLRLKAGIPAPRSGSVETNGRVVAEQIGAQIFIDGWAMVAPGDPELAVSLARRAASVSHDGEAVSAAQVVAAVEAGAFVERDLGRLLDTALALVPPDGQVRRVVEDLRAWRAAEPDWRRTRRRVAERYGYERYGGDCPCLPNFALVILALLYGEDDFQRSLGIVTTSGWDTDCNAGTVGCILGIKNGLAGIDAGPDWRGPVADRLYLPTADGGRTVTDAVSEAYRLAGVGRALAGEPPAAPKGGARFHFDLPGAVQGWRAEEGPETRGVLQLENVAGRSAWPDGRRALALRYRGLAPGRAARAGTATFLPPEALRPGGYGLVASPTLYPGQTLRAALAADPDNARPVRCGLYVRTYGAEDRPELHRGPGAELGPGERQVLAWRLPDTGGAPVAEVGVELSAERRADGTVYLDWLTWDGVPDTVLDRPAAGGQMWLRAWVPAVDRLEASRGVPGAVYRLVQNRGTGLAICGCREWADYRTGALFVPHLAAAWGLAARVQGLTRYYALLLERGRGARLVRVLEGEGDAVLAEAELPWELGGRYRLELEVVGSCLRAWVDGRPLLEAVDRDRPLQSGAVGLVCGEGRIDVGPLRIGPALP